MTRQIHPRAVPAAAVTFVAMALMVIAACGGGDESSSSTTNVDPKTLPTNLTLTAGVPNDCGSPDFSAVAGTGGGNWVCTGLVTDGLLSTNYDTGETGTPWLAEKFEVSADGMQKTYTLRKGIQFQNGEPLNAAAVAFTYDRALGRAKYAGSEEFKGADGPTLLARLKDDEPYTVLDEYTIRLNYKVLDVAHTGSVTPVPPQFIQQNGDAAYARTPISTGPYKLVSRTPAAEIVLERNDNYWNKDGHVPGQYRWSPNFAKIVHKVIPEEQTRIAAVQRREVDMITSVSPGLLPSLAQEPTVKILNIAGPQAIYILINSCLETDPNTGQPNPFRNLKVRQAMSYAVDVDGIVKNLLTGTESRHAGMPPNQPYVDYKSLTFYPYDLAKAKQLMTEAGFPGGLPGTYDITVPTGRWTASGEVTELITTQLRAIGINARMRPAEYQPVTVGIQNHTMFPMAFFGVFSNVDSNLSGGMLGGHTAGGNTCEGRWNMTMLDPEIDALAKKASETVDEKARAALTTQAYKIWGDKAYTINLYANSVSHVYRSDFSWDPPKAESTSVYNPGKILPSAPKVAR